MKPWPTYYEADSNQTAHEIPEPGRWAGKHEVSGRPIWKPQEMQGSGPHASELGDTRAGRHQIAPYEMLGDSAWNAGHR